METLKYAVKPDDIIADNENPKSREWFYELTRQTHKLRFVATGGVLKDALRRDEDITNDDMITTGNDDETTETDDRRLNFTFMVLWENTCITPIITSSDLTDKARLDVSPCRMKQRQSFCPTNGVFVSWLMVHAEVSACY